MHRIAFSRTTLVLVVAGIMSVGLASCGGGGGNGGGGRNGTVVLPPGNRAPVVARTIVPATSTIVLTLEVGNPTRARWLTPQGLDYYFSDPDGDTLSYSVRSSDPGVVEPEVAFLLDDEKRVALGGLRGGTATITVTARDPDGRSVSQSFGVRVDDRGSGTGTPPTNPPPPTNRPPQVATRFQDLTHTVSSLEDQRRTWPFNLASYFSDPDGDRLTYSAKTSNVFFAAVSVTGNQLNVRSGVDGVATITVTATDPGGLAATQSFRLTTTFRPPDPAVRYYGALAFSFKSNQCSGGYAAGIVSGYTNRAQAELAALDECNARGGRDCSSYVREFGSAYTAGNECAALAYGDSSGGCRLRHGRGSTILAAESDALARCRTGGYTCSLTRAEGGGRFAMCTQ